MSPLLAGLALAAALAAPAWADDEDDDWGDEGDDAAGFEDPGQTTVSAPAAAPSPVSVDGFLRTEEALWTERLDDRPLAKARQSLDLALTYKGRRSRFVVAGHGEYDLAWRIDRDDQDVPSREIYERDLQLREAFVGLELGSFDLTVGRQVVAWGEGDAISPVDVVNPRDMREPGLADLDDIRLPVLASRLGWFHGDHRLEVMAVHEPNWGLRSPPLGEFSPLPSLLSGGAPAAEAAAALGPLLTKDLRYAHTPDEGAPDFDLDDHGWFARWVYKGDAMDLGLYAASLLHQQGVFEAPEITPSLLVPGGDLDLPIRHERYTMLGHSGATASGSWLVKWEAALDLGRPVNVILEPLGDDEVDIVTPALGVTYTGFADTSVTVEAQRAFVVADPEGPGRLAFDPELPVVAVRAQRTYLREDLTVALAATVFGAEAEQGWLARGEVSYKFMDGWKASVGYITYQPGDDLGLLSALEEHDRLFTKVRWDFRIL